jgi:hypothetical protein
MTGAAFWRLIEETGREAEGDVDRQVELIRDALAEMSVKEILSFERQLRAKLRRAYTFDLMAAAFIVMSYVSDDTFEDFRAWLVAQGKERFERAIETPESIAELLERDAVARVQGEALLTCAMAAYEQKTGRGVEEFLIKMKTLGDPAVRQDWPETKAQFRERYPVLFDKFWNQERIAQLHPVQEEKRSAKRQREGKSGR